MPQIYFERHIVDSPASVIQLQTLPYFNSALVFLKLF